MAELSIQGVSSIAFVIGGSCGLSDQVKAAARMKLSMSKMTFPHQLARVMLLEQIYRPFPFKPGPGTTNKSFPQAPSGAFFCPGTPLPTLA